ncbi:MAG: glycosyltransferase family 39 protein [Gemmatimonadaceae bacterium]
MKRRILYAAGAVMVLMIAWRLPTQWYYSLPRDPDTPPLPFSGVDLLRWTFVIEAILLAVLASAKWTWQSIPENELLRLRRPEASSDLSRSRALIAVAFITLVAIVLRSYKLGSDLWLDEITPIVDYGHMPVVQVIGSYLRTNNHLLNTLLTRLSIGAFGESEWSVRFPAVLFGVATIPVFYWVARVVLSRWASVAATAVLAVSYHHIFFSQNARGYSAALFFALATSGLLIKALADDKKSRWLLYAVCMFLGLASLAQTAFVFAAHFIVGLIAVILIRKRAGSAAPLARRLAIVFGITALISFQLYATPLPEMYAVITHLYVREATGFAPFSLVFLREIVRGVTSGLGGVVPSVLFLMVGAAGTVFLVRANWILAAALGLPPVLTAIFLLARGLSFSPRFFLLLLPFGILASLSVAESPAMRYPRRAVLLAVLFALASLISLRRYYNTPKQPYRAALAFLERTRHPGEKFLIIYAAEQGFRYYVPKVAAGNRDAYVYVRTVTSFDSLVSRTNANDRVVTTFPRVLHDDIPELADRIESGWRPQRLFSATIGDGEITVWEKKSP